MVCVGFVWGTKVRLQTDPAAEKYFGLSPYNSMGNNPVRFSDPDGDDWFYGNGQFLWFNTNADNIILDGVQWNNYGTNFSTISKELVTNYRDNGVFDHFSSRSDLSQILVSANRNSGIDFWIFNIDLDGHVRAYIDYGLVGGFDVGPVGYSAKLATVTVFDMKHSIKNGGYVYSFGDDNIAYGSIITGSVEAGGLDGKIGYKWNSINGQQFDKIGMGVPFFEGKFTQNDFRFGLQEDFGIATSPLLGLGYSLNFDIAIQFTISFK